MEDYYRKCDNNLDRGLPFMYVDTFVYPYPVNVFVIRQLETTVEHFCGLYGFNQEMVASCVIKGAFSRNVVCVVYLCFEFSFRSMGEIYEELFKLQDDD